MRRFTCLLAVSFAALTALAAENAVDRWAKAAGGRERIAAVKAIYREGTLNFAGFEGTIKVWHTADGKFRKEEQVGMFSTVETFDGTTLLVQRNGAPPRQLSGAELALESSKAYSNSNAIFFVFFPKRHAGGRVDVEGDDTVVFQPQDGVEWRVTLDAQTSLPKTMTHQEGDRTITVSFPSYETVDGIKVESEIRRSAGDAKNGTVIRFSKTVINPTIDASLFTAPR